MFLLPPAAALRRLTEIYVLQIKVRLNCTDCAAWFHAESPEERNASRD